MILIALGSNLSSRFGSPAETLAAAYDALQQAGINIVQKSRLWLTAPVPISDQPWFHNAVIQVETNLSPQDLMAALHVIEEDFGRVRMVRNEARILDLDIVAYDDIIVDGPGLHLPHPRLHERAFVLYPLQDIAPNWIHPVKGRSTNQMLSLIFDQDAKPAVA